MAKKKSTPKSNPTILITNDDGITSPGIRALVEESMKVGKVVVVASDGMQSGWGLAIIINNLLGFERVDFFEGVESYKCSGTVVGWLKVAENKIIKRKPDQTEDNTSELQSPM